MGSPMISLLFRALQYAYFPISSIVRYKIYSIQFFECLIWSIFGAIIPFWLSFTIHSLKHLLSGKVLSPECSKSIWNVDYQSCIDLIFLFESKVTKINKFGGFSKIHWMVFNTKRCRTYKNLKTIVVLRPNRTNFIQLTSLLHAISDHTSLS